MDRRRVGQSDRLKDGQLDIQTLCTVTGECIPALILAGPSVSLADQQVKHPS